MFVHVPVLTGSEEWLPRVHVWTGSGPLTQYGFQDGSCSCGSLLHWFLSHLGQIVTSSTKVVTSSYLQVSFRTRVMVPCRNPPQCPVLDRGQSPEIRHLVHTDTQFLDRPIHLVWCHQSRFFFFFFFLIDQLAYELFALVPNWLAHAAIAANCLLMGCD